MNSKVGSLGGKKPQKTFILTDQEKNKIQITKIRNEGQILQPTLE